MQITPELKQQIIQAHINGMTAREAEKKWGVPTAHVYNWAATYRKQQSKASTARKAKASTATTTTSAPAKSTGTKNWEALYLQENANGQRKDQVISFLIENGSYAPAVIKLIGLATGTSFETTTQNGMSTGELHHN
jgi:transposase-like protein